MNKKKTIIINMLLAAVLITVWLVFPKKTALIDLPSSKDIASIEVITTDGNKVDLLETNHLEQVMNSLTCAEPTRTQSVNDQPTNVEAYGTININTDDVVWVLYYYEKNGKHYIEQPYRGVYELKESFENYLSIL